MFVREALEATKDNRRDCANLLLPADVEHHLQLGKHDFAVACCPS